jgi:hypothetical protein
MSKKLEIEMRGEKKWLRRHMGWKEIGVRQATVLVKQL